LNARSTRREPADSSTFLGGRQRCQLQDSSRTLPPATRGCCWPLACARSTSGSDELSSCGSTQERDISAVISPNTSGPDPKLRGVGGAENQATIEQFLELPYHIGVRSELEAGRSLWKATVEELPGCVADGRTPDEAVTRLRRAMESWFSTALSERREIPAPRREAAPGTSRAMRGYSSSFLVRMPKSLHAELARAAEGEQVSLNRFVTDVLAARVAQGEYSPRTTTPESTVRDDEPAMGDRQSSTRALRVALATNLVVVVLAGLIALALLVLALQRV
jgi:antitoxin HicB